MADNVGVSTGTGATVAAEDIGGIEFQRVKLVDGLAGSTGYIQATTGVPGVAATGLVVAVIPGAVVTITGVQSVNVSGVVPVVTQASVSVSGIPVWMNPTQGVTILGTQIVKGTVDVVPGVSVTVSGQIVTNTGIQAVNISGVVPVVTQASVSVSGIPVWMNPTQGVTILGLQNVSISGIVPVPTQASVSVTGLPVWMNPTQGVTILGLQTAVVQISTSQTIGTIVTVLGVAAVQISTSQTIGTIVTILGLQVVTITGLQTALVTLPTVIPFLAVVTSTTPAISSTLIFTVWTGPLVAAAAATQFVPGKNLRIMGVTMVYAGSIALAVTAQLNINLGISASLLTASQVTQGKIAVLMVMLSGVATSTAAIQGQYGDVQAASTMGLFWQGTSITIQNIVISGYLF